VIKPLYSIPKAGTYWFGTYHKHHREKLRIKTSTYDLCLLITKDKEGPFGLVGIQTNDTLILRDDQFIVQEDVELKKAELLAKPSKQLTKDNLLLFNRCKLVINSNTVTLTQKEQGKRLDLVKTSSYKSDVQQAYLKQRARGAYIGTIC
jgi:hypothetical protein